MSEQLLEIGVGLSLNNAVSIIYGNGAPGQSEATGSAPVGSSYSDVDTGAKWQKIASNGGYGDWVELAGKDAAITVQHIASTGVILDQVPTQLATEFAWMVTAYNEADPSNKYSAIVHMSHNGTATEDATNVNYDSSSILRQGAKISGLQITGTLTGQGTNQFMNLHVSSGSMVTFIAYRMVKNIAGSNTVILGGANLSNHIADGSVHLQVWQNTLLDSISQSLTGTQVNTLVGVTGAIQTQLDSKASSSSLATVATSGAYSDLTGKPSLATVATSGSYSDLTGKPSDYSLPTASTTTLGGVKVDGTTITVSNGVISGANTYSLPTASDSVLGGVKVGSGLSIDGAGVLTAAGAVTSVGGNTGAVTAAQLGAAVATAGSGLPYDIYGSCFGAPANGETVTRFVTARAFTIPANFAGSYAKAGTSATASSTWSVQKNGTQVATVVFAGAGTTGTFSTQAAVSFAAGDKFGIVAPATADATLGDVDFAIIAVL